MPGKLVIAALLSVGALAWISGPAKANQNESGFRIEQSIAANRDELLTVQLTGSGSVQNGETTLVEAHGTCSGCEPSYRWEASGGILSSQSNGTQVQWTPPQVANDTVFRIYCSLQDGNGRIASNKLDILVIGSGTTSPGQTSSGQFSSPSGTHYGNVTLSANIADADGLNRVTAKFVPGGQELVLCGSGSSTSCTGTTQAVSRSNIDPATYGAASGTVTLHLSVEDLLGNINEVDTHSFSWSPASPGSGYTLTVTKLGNGAGTVTGNGIDCGPGCTSASATFQHSDLVTLAGSGSQFIGFMGNSCYGVAPCTFGMFKDVTVKASFSLPDSLGVTFTFPANGVTGASIGNPLSIYFNRGITIGPNIGGVALKRCDGGAPIGVSPVIGGSSSQRLTLYGASLERGTCYAVEVPASSVSDLEGNLLQAPYSFSFTTEVPGTPKMYVSAYPTYVAEGSPSKVSIWFETPVDFDRTLNLTSTPASTLIHPASVVLPAGEVLAELEVDSYYAHGSLSGVTALLLVQEASAGTGSANIVVFNTTSSNGANLSWLASGIVWDEDGDGVFESNERADILLEVANLGSQPIYNVVLDFSPESNSNLWFTGSSPHTCVIGYLAPYQSGDCTATLVADDDLPTGTYFIRVHGSGTVGSTTNHMYAATPIQVLNRELPDFTILAGPITSSPRQPGSLQILRYTPSNSGDGFDERLPRFDVFIEIDGQEQLLHSTYADARGDTSHSQTFDLPIIVPNAPGAHKIRAQINPDGVIPESDFGNNEANELTLNIAESNQAPSLPSTIGALAVNIGELLSFSVVASDPNNDPLTYSLGPGAPTGLSIGASSGLLSWTPECATTAQIYSVDVQVVDPAGLADSGTLTIDVGRQADLAIAVTSNPQSALPGQPVEFAVDVTNNGPSCTTGATVNDAFSAQLSEITWTCVASVGSSCTAGPFSGDIADNAVNLLNGGTASYVVNAKIVDNALNLISNVATLGTPTGTIDPISINNSDEASISLRSLDFGDAADTSLDPAWRFPTRLVDNGARHGVDAFFTLGSSIDSENEGQPSYGALGDDLTAGDDEDGVAFLTPLRTCEPAQIDVTASAAGLLDAWADFSGDGDWDDVGEQVYTSQSLTSGINSLSFNVPCGAVPAEEIFLRFRLSSAGGLSFTGLALDGEVEDYAVPFWQCSPPASGDWVVSTSCTYSRTSVAPASVIVEPGVVLTIEPGAILEIDLKTYKLLVRQGGGVMVREGGTVRQTSGTLNP